MKRLRLVAVDNFARETVSDSLVADYVHEYYADSLLKALREKYTANNSPTWFVLRDNLYMQYAEHAYGFNTAADDWWDQQIQDLENDNG